MMTAVCLEAEENGDAFQGEENIILLKKLRTLSKWPKYFGNYANYLFLCSPNTGLGEKTHISGRKGPQDQGGFAFKSNIIRCFCSSHVQVD